MTSAFPSTSVLFASLLLTSAAAAEPMTLTYQGRVLDVMGTPPAPGGTVTVVLHSAATTPEGESTDVFTEDFVGAVQADGYFSVVLGEDQSPVLQSSVFDTPVWVEVHVNGTELGRRQRVTTVPTGQSVAAAGDPALLAHYTFDDPAALGADSGDFGLNASFNPSQITHNANGRVGGSAVLDGSGYFSIADHEAWDVADDDFTWAVFFKVDPVNNMSIHPGLYVPQSESTNGWDYLSLYSQTDGSAQLYGGVSSSSTVGVHSDGGLWDGTWHHVAVVREGITFRMYVDGELVHADTERITFPDRTGPSHIGGCYTTDLGCKLDGELDDLRLYSRALTPDQVAALANQ